MQPEADFAVLVVMRPARPRKSNELDHDDTHPKDTEHRDQKQKMLEPEESLKHGHRLIKQPSRRTIAHPER